MEQETMICPVCGGTIEVEHGTDGACDACDTRLVEGKIMEFPIRYNDRPVKASDDYDPIPEDVFHYYEKAKRLGRDAVAYSILHGELSVQEIEENERFAWLAD
jgi:hypothetical protein